MPVILLCIKCWQSMVMVVHRISDLTPDCAVLVATVRALKTHGAPSQHSVSCSELSTVPWSFTVSVSICPGLTVPCSYCLTVTLAVPCSISVSPSLCRNAPCSYCVSLSLSPCLSLRLALTHAYICTCRRWSQNRARYAATVTWISFVIVPTCRSSFGFRIHNRESGATRTGP